MVARTGAETAEPESNQHRSPSVIRTVTISCVYHHYESSPAAPVNTTAAYLSFQAAVQEDALFISAYQEQSMATCHAVVFPPHTHPAYPALPDPSHLGLQAHRAPPQLEQLLLEALPLTHLVSQGAQGLGGRGGQRGAGVVRGAVVRGAEVGTMKEESRIEMSEEH